MEEIQATTLQVKLSDGYEDKTVLVHDGKRIVDVVESGSGKIGVPAGVTMVAGTKAEIEAEIERLQLKPKFTRGEKIDRRRAELQAKHDIKEAQKASEKDS